MPVRVTSLRGIDLNTFAYDFDLTFSALLMHADGTVYHRYGGRDHTGADAFLSMPSFVRLLKEGVATHEAYIKAPAPPQRKVRTLDDIPVWKQKMARTKKKPTCYHCHFVYDAEREQQRADKTWSRLNIWRYPSARHIGLVLDQDLQQKVVSVKPGSVAFKAGVHPGDRLLRLGTQRILTQSDLSWVLEQTPANGAKLPLTVRRSGSETRLWLALPPGWRVGSARSFAWRPSKWQLRPRPGFGGRPLNAGQKRAAKLDPKRFAVRVTYIVTWGREPKYGRNAQKAGIRRGDLVGEFRLNGKPVDLTSQDHLHAWWRLDLKPGDEVRATRVRKGKRATITIPVIE